MPLYNFGSGGGGNTIYNADDSLTGNRIVNLLSYSLDFNGGPTYFDDTAAVGKVTIASIDRAIFSHKNHFDTTNYALLQTENGITVLNAVSGQKVNFNVGNVTHASLFDTGNLSIGNSSASARLHVKGTGSTSATSTALFENSLGTDLLDIKDDGTGIINATGRIIRLFKSTAFNPYIELNSSVGDNCSFVFSQGASSKYSIGFENFTGDFRIFDIAAGVNRLSVTSTGKINLFAPSTTTENFNVKGTGLFEINDNNPLTVRTTNNANMFLAIDSASTSWHSQVQFQQGTAAKWNIGCLGNTQSFWFYNHATTNTPLEIDSSDNIIMANLPTSSAGLPTGALWNNSGVINIV